MSFTLTVNIEVVPEGEYRFSLPLAPSLPVMVDRVEPAIGGQREDKVLPLGSSTLSPGLVVPVAG